MQWSDEGIVLGVRRHGESSVIAELMTREHGRHLGLVHGGRSRARPPTLQPGNLVQVTWRARLDEHLGTYQIEGLKLRAGELISSPLALYGLATLSHLLRNLPERDPHTALYETLTTLMDNLTDPDLAPPLFVLFELSILAEFGFGLDLTSCAATGTQDNLVYVSPKSGRAVSADAGEPYKDRLLRLPSFLIGRSRANRPRPDEIRDAFALTDFFLHQHVFGPNGGSAPPERARFIDLATPELGPARR
jgi:DNA repair protein RecO (recombination protein O)